MKHIIRIVLLAAVSAALAIASIYNLNRSGFCYKRFEWVSDEELMARAITGYNRTSSTKAEQDREVAMFMQKSPNCCKKFTLDELYGTITPIDLVDLGLTPRPAYFSIMVSPADKIGLRKSISSCADEELEWNGVPQVVGDPVI